MDTINQSVSRTRRISGAAVIVLCGVALLVSAAVKFAHVPKVTQQLGAMGFSGDRLTLVAVLEVVSATLILVPSTRAVGLLLASAFLGGAIATHVQHGHPVLQPAVFLALLWLGVWLRHPAVLWSVPDRSSRIPVASARHQKRALASI